MFSRSSARRVFESGVCAAALLLPVLALVLAPGSGDTTFDRPASAQEPAAAGASDAGGTTGSAGSAGSAGSGSAPPRQGPALNYRTSWIGNTWGYAHGQWMQIDVQAMAVTPDGDVFTNALWDEGGGEIGHFRDGRLIGYGGQSHGWGMLGGDAIAANSRYVFVAQVVESIGDALAQKNNLPVPGVRWYGVSRRSRADIARSVPFAAQVRWPGSPLAFRLIARSPAGEDDAIRGLAADEHTLFVSNLRENRVEQFDAGSMQRIGQFAVREPGRIAIALDGSLWIIERIRTDGERRIVHYARNGQRLGELRLPAGAVPVDLCFDAGGRLLVADNGPRQQVLIFGTAHRARTEADGTAAATRNDGETSMRLTATLGETGGIYAGRAGAVGPLRFNGLTGVGADRAGNVYVSTNGMGPREPNAGEGSSSTDGATLESYTPDGKRRFVLQGLLFVDGAQFVDGNPPSVYSGSKRFVLDPTRGEGAGWSYAGYTANRFRYPYDPFFHLQQGRRGAPLVREIDGHRLLFTIDMTSSYLRVYRFGHDGETAIPSGFFAPAHIDGPWPPRQPARGEWIWRDTAGRGRFAAGDFDRPAGSGESDESGERLHVTGWWVDRRGDVWQATAADGIRRFPLQGFDGSGNPIYRYRAMQRFAAPAPFTRITRLIYDVAADTMIVGGSTAARPYNEHNWNSVGSTLARYDHWSSGKPVLRYTIDLPDSGPPGATRAIAGIATAGDYLFAAGTATGNVRVYDIDSGREAGRLAPGPEVGGASGMIDESMPLSAHRLASGEYLVFVEEDWHGKILMYRFRPPPRPLPADSSSSGSTLARAGGKS